MPSKSVGDNYFPIGHLRKARFILDNDEIIGLVEIHQNTIDNYTCGCTLWFGDRPQDWELLSVNPLVIWPSIVCENCNSHGFIIEDKWVDESDFNSNKTLIIKDYLDGKHKHQNPKQR